MSKNSVFIYSDAFQTYKFHDRHPFNQLRVKLTYDLLQTLGALHDGQIVAPRLATDEELALVHDVDYIEAVKEAGKGQLSEDVALNYGLGTEDTPIFPNMHEASALLVGGTLTAVDYVLSGKAEHAL
ncbi:acetoin utilization protein AcuC, partial [Pseudoalteromonas sp. 2102]|nr:acetoin utilization protein AcuC [Pseudoalteromonas sp. 2102]